MCNLSVVAFLKGSNVWYLGFSNIQSLKQKKKNEETKRNGHLPREMHDYRNSVSELEFLLHYLDEHHGDEFCLYQ